MEFFYQIKIVASDYDSFNRPVATQGIVDANDKKEVLDFIEKEYPEYFDGNKVSQKLSKKSEQAVYVSIYELDDYWSKFWKQEITCTICGKVITQIQLKNFLGNVNSKTFTCCHECEEKRRELLPDENGEYWNGRCAYYYIYKITSKINGKVYIGYTEREPIFRWWEHFKHSTLPIGIALKEDGIESFTFEVVEKHRKESKTIEEMHEIETKYIKQHDSLVNGYNCINSKKVDTSIIDGQISLFD